MNRQPHAPNREIIVAKAIEEVVSELRLVDVADYIAFIRLEHFACISDIVDSAAELFFMPETLRLGHGGEAHVGWTENPRIVLDLELRPRGATVYFALSLTALHASVEVNYVAFDAPDPDPERNTAFLEAALEAARIRKTAAAICICRKGCFRGGFSMRAAAQRLPLALAARVDKRPKEEAAGGRAGPMEKALGRGCVLRSSALTAEANGPA